MDSGNGGGSTGGIPGGTLGAVSTLVFDLDGVVWRGNSPIEGAIEAIHQLRGAGKRCLFCTNNSSQTPAAFAEKLKGMGLEVEDDEIITSSSATAIYLSAQYTGPFLAYVIGGEGITTAMQKIGARIVHDRDIDDDTNVDCVVAGIDRSFSYDKLNTAQRLIRRGALFVATNRDATYPVEHGVIPGAGSIIASIETASGTTPVTIGKPRPVMLQLVQQKYNLQANQVAFIGDRLDTDIVCARRAGVAAILVLTGVTTLPQARRAKGELRPDAVFPDLPSLVNVIVENSLAPPLQTEDLPAMSVGSGAVEAAPVTQGAPREEAAFVPIAEEPAAAREITSVESANAQDALQETITQESIAQEAATGESSAESFSFAAATPAEEISTPADETPATQTMEASSQMPAGGDVLEWDENWFPDESGASNGEVGNAEISNGEGGNGEAQPAPETTEAENTSTTSASTSSGGFEWKLD